MSVPSGSDDPQGFYDEMWASCCRLDASSPAGFHRRRLVVQWAGEGAPSPAQVLDVGCGAGALVRDLARRFPGAEVVGADVSARALAETRLASPQSETFLLDLADPDFDQTHGARRATFDLVTCCEVLEHLEDDVRALIRLRSLLRPGGRLIVTVPGGRPTRFDAAIGHRRHYRPDELRAGLVQVGLQPVRVAAWGFPFHSAYRAAVRAASRAALPAARPGPEPPAASAVHPVLGWAYRVVGRGLRPLFYLNLSRWGQQVIALARRPPA